PAVLVGRARQRLDERADVGDDGEPALVPNVEQPLRGGRRGDFGREVRVQTDRKSTRLNSSHSQISYAVFCLKKKKKKKKESKQNKNKLKTILKVTNISIMYESNVDVITSSLILMLNINIIILIRYLESLI